MATPIYIPSLIGGVSQLPQSQRNPQTVDVADNAELHPFNGISKRAGTDPIAGEADNESLDFDTTTAGDPVDLETGVFVQWFNRDDGEQFIVLISPDKADTDADVVQIFNLEGEKQTVTYGTNDPRPYLVDNSSETATDQTFRAITVADGIFLLNRLVDTARTGDAITYVANSADLRGTSNANNLATWWDFPQPPTGTATPGAVDDDNLYYARQDEAGLPSGFWAAVSTTQPPWYERVRTEPENSEVDINTMPILISFDGTDFEAEAGDYKPRLSGDDLLNPGASFFGNALSDMVFFQNRLWFTSLEQIVSSRAGDLLNYWQDSTEIRTDADPIDLSISENRVSNIDHMVPFNNSLILFTRSNKQMQVGAQGPFGPNTVFLQPIGNFGVAPYIQPVTLNDMVVFMGERNFFNTMWGYRIDAETQSAQFRELTAHADRYIPATARRIAVSQRHTKLFISTRAEPNVLYVWDTGAWTRFTFDSDTFILSHEVIDDTLYLLIVRDGSLWLESNPVGQPSDDVVDIGGGQFQTMGFGVRLDRKQSITGVYDDVENETTFTLPYEDSESNTIVLGPAWDTGEGEDAVRLAGTILTPTVETVGGVTVLTVEGQWQQNAEETDAIVYVGRNYEMRIRLNHQYVRDENGVALFGNTQLLSGRLRFRNTVYFRVEVTPKGRFTREVEFHFPRVGETPFDGPYVEETGEHFFRIMGRNEDTLIDIVNDLPVPSTIVDGQIDAKFIYQRKTPT